MQYSIEIKQEHIGCCEDKENDRGFSLLPNSEFSVWTPKKNRVTVDYSTPVTPKSSRAPPRSLWDSIQEYMSLPQIQEAPVPAEAIDELIKRISRPGTILFHPYSDSSREQSKKSVSPKKVKSKSPEVQKSIVKSDLCWKQIIVLALVSNGNKFTHLHDIYKFVEDHFPYYPQTRNDRSWKGCVRSAARKSGIFMKDGENPIYRIVTAKFANQVQVLLSEMDKSTVGINNLESIQKMLKKHKRR